MSGITVCVQSYNHDKYIGICIDSLIKQNFKNFEIIIFDDGSTDKSLEIIKSYIDKFDFISLIKTRTPKNQTNFNIIIDHSKKFQKYFTVFHCDDFFHKDILKNLFLTMENNKSLLACGTDGYHVDENSKISGYPKIPNKIKNSSIFDQKQYVQHLFQYGFFFLNPSFIYKTEFFLKKKIYYNYKKFGYANDAGFFLELSKYGKIGLLNKKLLYYRVFKYSITGKFVKKSIKENDIFKVLRFCFKLKFKKNEKRSFIKMYNFLKMIDNTKINLKKILLKKDLNFEVVYISKNLLYSFSSLSNFSKIIFCFFMKYLVLFFPSRPIFIKINSFFKII